ncbi:MAG: nicotinate (nicotinamide) nucleotide adenylyltransferase [Parachlamydiales bacterium]|jgi:nicotinate-nucleotide adenylyltransferase
MISKQRSVGILGGTFDPIHIGHLSLALEMLDAHKLDEVWFCPAARNPLKKQGASASDEDRLAMIRLAIKDIPQLKCKNVELTRPAPSYTIDTLNIFQHEMLKKKRNTKFYLILGEDSAETFFDWKQPQDILKLVTVIVGRREIISKVKHNIPHELNNGITLTRYIEISGTDIRKRIRKGQHVEHLLPTPVWKYIKRKKIYN